jgi:hypothetical protein
MMIVDPLLDSVSGKVKLNQWSSLIVVEITVLVDFPPSHCFLGALVVTP